MAAENYSDSLARVLVNEGGKVDNPKDPGGRTNMGVTQRVYDGYRQRKGEPTRDVYDIEETEVQEIYKRQYWDAVRGDELPLGVDFAVFDSAVNSGPPRAVEWLQSALSVAVDGHLGEATLGALAAAGDPADIVKAISAARRDFLKGLSIFDTFGKGWMKRVDAVEAAALAWASGGSPPPVHAIPRAGGVAAPKSEASATGAASTVAVSGAAVAAGAGYEISKMTSAPVTTPASTPPATTPPPQTTSPPPTTSAPQTPPAQTPVPCPAPNVPPTNGVPPPSSPPGTPPATTGTQTAASPAAPTKMSSDEGIAWTLEFLGLLIFVLAIYLMLHRYRLARRTRAQAKAAQKAAAKHKKKKK